MLCTRSVHTVHLSMQAKNEGNDAFKAADYPKAIERYTEALKRGPPGLWEEAYKCFSNRAACYTKLGAMPEGALPLQPCSLLASPSCAETFMCGCFAVVVSCTDVTM